MTFNERQKQANEIRQGIENDVEDLAAHFEGGIYGGKRTIRFRHGHKIFATFLALIATLQIFALPTWPLRTIGPWTLGEPPEVDSSSDLVSIAGFLCSVGLQRPVNMEAAVVSIHCSVVLPNGELNGSRDPVVQDDLTRRFAAAIEREYGIEFRCSEYNSFEDVFHRYVATIGDIGLEIVTIGAFSPEGVLLAPYYTCLTVSKR